MREINFIFDTYPKLTRLCIQAGIEDASCLTTYQDIYPSLTTLEMAITAWSMTRSMTDYILTRFINLPSVTLHIQPTNCSTYDENFIHLMTALMTPYKRRFFFALNLKGCHEPDDEYTRMNYTCILSTCAIEAFKPQPRPFNSMEFTRVYVEPGIRICVDKELHCMLST